MSSLYLRGNKVWINYRDKHGIRHRLPTGFKVKRLSSRNGAPAPLAHALSHHKSFATTLRYYAALDMNQLRGILANSRDDGRWEGGREGVGISVTIWAHQKVRACSHSVSPCALITSSAPRGIRTPNPQIRSLMLYPVELWAHRAKGVIKLTKEPRSKQVILILQLPALLLEY